MSASISWETLVSPEALQRRLPSADLRLSGAVEGPVEILRDRAGVPHIFAGTTRDVYFGLGLAMAQDRLWQMDRLRRRALGRQAEILGAGYVKSDLTHLVVGIDRIADAESARLEGSAVGELLGAFVAGINRWIDESLAEQGRLPVEFDLLGYAPEPFTVRDVVAILRGMWWSLNGRLEQIVAAEAARLLPDEALRAAYLTPEAPEERIVPAEAPHPLLGAGPLRSAHSPASPARRGGTTIGTSMVSSPSPVGEGWPEAGVRSTSNPPHGSGDGTGSNNWAVAAGRTASGHAMLCSDPHQGFWLPSSWYEYALHGPEDRVAGAGHPGVPGIWFGSNGSAAWGITNNAASTRDLYVEEVHPEDPSLYRDGDTWRRFEEREVAIPVRGEATRRFTIRATVRGPIVNDVLPSVDEGGDPPLSLRWVGQEHLEDIRALVAIGRAKDWAGFRAALRDWAVPAFNFVYADATGFAGYQCAGRVPVRGRVTRGYRRASEPLDGWQGYVPFDALPRLEDPPCGYVASANNRPVADDFPYPLHGAWAAGHRATRLRQALDSDGDGSRFDRAQMVALQNDVKSCRAERLCPPLLARLSGCDDPDVRLFCDVLRGWDFRYTMDSAAPLLFEAFGQAWQARVAAERFPAHLAPLATGHGSAAAQVIEVGPERFPWFAGGPEAAHAALVESAQQAAARVRERLGPDAEQWRWGAVHLAHWRHVLSDDAASPAFDVGPAPVDGGADTVRNTGVSAAFQATSGAEYRLVVDFTTPDRFWAVQNTGNSGQPGSPHYADQFPDWLAGDYHLVHFRREEVEADHESQTLVAPEDN